jgi:hypothetical protein
MCRKILHGAFVALLLCCSLPGLAQDKGYWRAVSSNADAITGDLSISESRLSINMTAFSIAQIRPLKPAESSAVFDADPGEGGSGYLYRLNVPAAKRFLHHNTLCGSDDTQWMATYVHGRALRVAFFSGTDMPVDHARRPRQLNRRLRYFHLLALTCGRERKSLCELRPPGTSHSIYP